MLGLRRHLAVLLEYVLAIGLRAWKSLNMMEIVFGILHKKGVGKGHRAMVLCMEHGRTLVVGEWAGPKRNFPTYLQQPRHWSLETGFIYVGQLWRTFPIKLQGGGFLQLLRRSATMRNGKKRRHFSEFKSIHVFLKNYMHQPMHALNNVVCTWCWKRWVPISNRSLSWIEISIQQRFCFVCMYDINQVDQQKRASCCETWPRCHPASRQWSGRLAPALWKSEGDRGDFAWWMPPDEGIGTGDSVFGQGGFSSLF